MPEKQLPFDTQDFANILGDVPSPVPSADGDSPTTKSLPLDQHPVALYIASLSSPTSQRTQLQALNTIAELLGNSDAFDMDWSRLRYQHTRALRARLVERYSPATVNKFLVALRSALKHAFLLGQMTAENYQQAIQFKSVKVEQSETGRVLSSSEITALFQVCDDGTKAGIRDSAVLALLYATGLTRSEIISLDLKDYSGNHLIVTGKRKMRRVIEISDNLQEILEDWLVIRGMENGPLFLGINKGNTIRLGERLTAQAIYYLVCRRGEQANVKGFSPQDLRRTCIHDLLVTGADMAVIAKMVGHKDVRITVNYYQKKDNERKRHLSPLHIPSVRRG